MAFTSRRREAEQEIDDLLRRLNAAGAQTVDNNAKKSAPVDTGRLRTSIAHDSDKSGFVVGTNVEYAVYQEFGTRHQSGTPFLRPGLTRSIPDLRRIYGGK